MDKNRPNKDEIFNAAAEFADANERSAYLDQACGGSLTLRAEIEELLKHDLEEDSLLDRSAAGIGATLDQLPLERPGTQIGPYKLLQEIGEGGMGVVYLAEQTEPVRRRVALKLIKPGMDTRQVIARFEAERQALAIMDHPNIARVLDCGTTTTGHPYFVMELVKGVPITRYCDDNHLTPRERLELFVPICQAIQHAHQKGIIHRDIKPSNILVAEYDQKPVPKIIDFGVAKALNQQLTDKTNFTGLGQVVGTIEYMSPEQARVNQLDIDTRSDIYSLGVLLYELLTGVTPFDRKRLLAAALDELLRIIREEEPPRPSTRLSTIDTLPTVAANRHIEPRKLSALLHGELDWIVMKALEKDRARRYETASSFAADVAHYLNDEPVLACPPSARYRFGKFARRNKGRLVTASLLAAALLVAVGGVGWAVRDREALRTEVAREKTERQQRVTTQVELLLADADRQMQEQQWDDALATVRRAEVAIAGGDAGGELGEKVQTTLKELEFVARINEIRMEKSVWKNDGFDNAGAMQSYRQTFRDFGVDVELLPVATAMAQLKQHPRIIVPVATALDDFVHARRSVLGGDDAGWQSLVEMARGLDPDPVCDHLRATWGNKITPELQASLRELAVAFEVRKHSPNTAVSLAYTLERSQLVELQEQILRQAQQIFPGDFWVNLNLGHLLSERKQFADAVRFDSAALGAKPDSTAALNNLALALADQGKLEEAIDCYRIAIELDPNFAYGHRNLGNALSKQGKLDEAIAEHRKAIELVPKFADAHNGLGNALQDQGKLDEAIECYRTAIELDPKYAPAHNNLGSALSKQGKLDEAIDEYRTAIELDPKDALAHSNLGVALKEQGKLDDAITEHHKAIELDPKDALAHSNLGVALKEQGKLDEAIAEYRTAIELDPKDALAHSNLGKALSDQGKLDEAVDEHRKAIELDPELADAYNSLGKALSDQGKLDEAIAEHRKAIELDPKNALAHSNLGVALKEQGKLDEAIAEYRKAIELDPKYAPTHNNLGNALNDQGKLDEAIAEHHKAIELDPKLAPAHSNLGNALAKQGKLDDAIGKHRMAIELDPKYAPAHYNLGNALNDQGKLDEAIDEYRTAIELDPKFAYAHNGLGHALYDQGKLDEAIAEVRKAIELDPKFAMAHNNLGSALHRQGQWNEAIAELRKAIELDPKLAMAHYNLGNALRERGQLEAAIAEFRKTIELDPKDAGAHSGLGFTLMEQGKLDEAIECYRQAIKLDPNDANPYANLVWILATAEDPALRNPAEAVTLARKAKELQPEDVNHWCNLGVAEYRVGNWQAVVDTFRQVDVLIGGDGDRQHRFFLAMAHWQLGNQAQAHEAYEQAIAWLSENIINDVEQFRFREEAETVLGIAGKKLPETDQKPEQEKIETKKSDPDQGEKGSGTNSAKHPSGHLAIDS